MSWVSFFFSFSSFVDLNIRGCILKGARKMEMGGTDGFDRLSS